MQVRLRDVGGRRLVNLQSAGIAVELREPAADRSQLLGARLRALAAVLERLAAEPRRGGSSEAGGAIGRIPVVLLAEHAEAMSSAAVVRLGVAGVVLEDTPPMEADRPGAAGLPAGPDGDAALRYFALSAPYHQPWCFSATGLEAARAALDGLCEEARRLAEAGPAPPPYSPGGEALRAAFWQALADDLDTPSALAVLWRIARADLEPAERRALMLEADAVLDLGLVGASTPAEADLPAEAQVLIELRTAARRERDWARSDALRDELVALGVEARDGPDGSTYLRR